MKYVVIAYDIEDDRQRSKVADALLNAGLQRVQKSVFEGGIEKKALQKLMSALRKRVKKHDSIRYYSLCKNCTSNTIIHGANQLPGKKQGRVIIS